MATDQELMDKHGITQDELDGIKAAAKVSNVSVEEEAEKQYGGGAGGTEYPRKAAQAISYAKDVKQQFTPLNVDAWRQAPYQTTGEWKGLATRAGQLGDEVKYSPTSRAYIDTLRQNQRNILNKMGRYAAGEDSVVQRQSELEREAMANMLASQTAGAYDPARARAAAQALGQGMTGLGAQTAIGKMQEQQAAMQQYAQQAGSMRAQELAQQQQEAAQEQAMRQYNVQREELKQKYMQMGMAEEYAQQAAEQEMERLRVAQDQANLEMALRAMYGIEGGGTNWGQVIGGIGGAVAGMAPFLARSDSRMKDEVFSGEACKKDLGRADSALYSQMDNSKTTFNPAILTGAQQTKNMAPPAGRVTDTPLRPILPNSNIGQAGGAGNIGADVSRLYQPGPGERTPFKYDMTPYRQKEEAPGARYVGAEGSENRSLSRGYGRNIIDEWRRRQAAEQAAAASPVFSRDLQASPEWVNKFHGGVTPGMEAASTVASTPTNIGGIVSPLITNYDVAGGVTPGMEAASQVDGTPLNLARLQRPLSTDYRVPSTVNSYDEAMAGLQNNLRNVVFSGQACKDALADGNMPLYDMLQDAAKNQTFGLGAGQLGAQVGAAMGGAGVPSITPAAGAATMPEKMRNVEPKIPQQTQDGADLNMTLAALGTSAKGLGALASGLMGDPVTSKYMRPQGNYFTNLIRSPQAGASASFAKSIMSDSGAKECLNPDMTPDELFDYLDKLRPVQFKYKPEFQEIAGSQGGVRTGIYADDAAKSNLGSEMVKEDPATGMKMLDLNPQKSIPLLMGTDAHLHQRIKRLEDRLKGGRK